MEFLTDHFLLISLVILANVLLEGGVVGHNGNLDDFESENSGYVNKEYINKVNRSSFPKGFLFGTASSAYQVN